MKKTAFRFIKFEIPFVLLGLWGLSIILVNPIGDFPLNDDFSFGRTVFNVSEVGTWKFDDWLSMTLIAQVYWGSAFTKLFGFSFTVLRFSTLVLSTIGIVSMYLICRELKTDKLTASVVTALIAFNPLYFSLSFTFMTDVPFLSLCLISILFFIKFFTKGGNKWMILGTLFAILATLIRQLGVMLPISFALTYLIFNKKKTFGWIVAIAPLIATILSLYVYNYWFTSLQEAPSTFGTLPKLFKRLNHTDFWKICWDRIGLLLIYFGLFLLPLFILKVQKSKVNLKLAAPLITICLIAMFSIWNRFPWGNILYNFGLGPKTLKDGVFFINVSPILSPWVWKTIALFGMAGVVLAFLRIDFKALKFSQTKVFALSNTILYSGFLMLDVHFFDRYFLPLLPFLLILFLPKKLTASSTKILLYSSLSFLLIMSMFSIAATHDYLSWNRARWKALDHLTNELKISPNEINGGFEFNGWHRPVKEQTYGTFKSWWWVDQENYVITFGEMDGFKPIKSFQYNSYLPLINCEIFILQKE